MRLFFIIITVINFFFLGPIVVGIPVLANQRLPEGAAAFGIIMSAYGDGNLIGIVLSGAINQKKGLHWMAAGVVSSFGISWGLLGVLNNTWLSAALLFVLGIGNGYISIILITFLQRRTPTNMLGRIMSLLLLANVGLGLISHAVAGAISKLSLEALFLGAGACILITRIRSALHPALKLMDEQFANAQTPAVSIALLY